MLNKRGVKTQTALISWLDVCLFLFLLIFPAFIDQQRSPFIKFFC